jgi:hypothetical protein
MSHLNIDIICGSDVARSMPINSAVIYIRIDDIGVQFENASFFKFLNILEFMGDLSKMKNVQACRPRMNPVTERSAHQLSKEMKYGPSESAQLNKIRKMIVKEYFRFFAWFGLSDKYSDFIIDNLPANTAIEYNYKMGSLFYQLFYGET